MTVIDFLRIGIQHVTLFGTVYLLLQAGKNYLYSCEYLSIGSLGRGLSLLLASALYGAMGTGGMYAVRTWGGPAWWLELMK